MAIKLFDSEFKVMEVLWKEGNISAKRIAEILKEQVNWSKTTTYTVIKKCLEKGALQRIEPNFICSPLITINEAREYEAVELIKSRYNGSADLLVASIVGQNNLSKDEIERIKQIVRDLE